VRVSAAMALASLGGEASAARASLESIQQGAVKRLAAVATAALKTSSSPDVGKTLTPMR
jgi:hypothetical protein